jgi:Arc/MetJ-type ribon-helix-helix transcriptional regulator
MYDKGMSKRRVTLTLDEDIIEAFQQLEGRSLSAVVNAALREAIASENHRKAALKWLDDLNTKYGKGTPEEAAEIDAWLDEIGFDNSADNAAGAA